MSVGTDVEYWFLPVPRLSFGRLYVIFYVKPQNSTSTISPKSEDGN